MELLDVAARQEKAQLVWKRIALPDIWLLYTFIFCFGRSWKNQQNYPPGINNGLLDNPPFSSMIFPEHQFVEDLLIAMFDYQRVGDGFQKLSQVAGDSRLFSTGRTGHLKIIQPKVSPNLVDEHRIPEDRPPTPRMELHTAGHLGSKHHFCWHFIHVHWTFPDIFTRKTPWFPSISPSKNLCVEVFHQERTAADRLETVGEYVADFCGLDRCVSIGHFTVTFAIENHHL